MQEESSLHDHFLTEVYSGNDTGHSVADSFDLHLVPRKSSLGLLDEHVISASGKYQRLFRHLQAGAHHIRELGSDERRRGVGELQIWPQLLCRVDVALHHDTVDRTREGEVLVDRFAAAAVEPDLAGRTREP